jgi:hypothetical protein
MLLVCDLRSGAHLFHSIGPGDSKCNDHCGVVGWSGVSVFYKSFTRAHGGGGGGSFVSVPVIGRDAEISRLRLAVAALRGGAGGARDPPINHAHFACRFYPRQLNKLRLVLLVAVGHCLTFRITKRIGATLHTTSAWGSEMITHASPCGRPPLPRREGHIVLRTPSAGQQLR